MLLGDIKKEEEDENEDEVEERSEIVKWLKAEVRVRKKEGRKGNRMSLGGYLQALSS